MAYAKPHPSTMNKSFEEWNPMEDDYKNKQFNSYLQGPGADLDADLQPGALANQSREQQQKYSREGRYQLCLRHVPQEMTKEAVRRICSSYGNVVCVYEIPRTSTKFVTFATLADMNNALRKLQDNPYKITVEIAKQTRSILAGAGNVNNSNMSLASVQNGKENHVPQYQYKKPDMSRSESKETMRNIKKLSESSIGNYNSDKNLYENISSQNEKVEPKVCAYCAKLADKMCTACDECYCSIECQKTDWPRHQNHCPARKTKISEKTAGILNNDKQNSSNNSSNRTIESCNLMNKCGDLSTNNNRSNKRASNSSSSSSSGIIKMMELPKSGSRITITTVVKPNVFYIRSMASEDNVEYVKMLNIISSHAARAKALEKLPEKGDVCITDFQDSGYYRVLVLNPVNKNKINVIYMDFGNVEEKKLSDLKEASTEICSLKCHILKVCLKNIPDFIPTQKLTNFLHSYVDNLNVDLKLMYSEDDFNKSKGACEVEIIDITNNICLNKKILEMRVINEPKDSEVPIYVTDIERQLLPSGKNIDVFVTDNSLLPLGYISCILPKDMITLQELTIQLKEYAEKIDGPYTPRQFELCIVQYDDGEWYRAECLEIVGDEHPSVSFIDYGNMSPVHISKIRKYPKALKYNKCATSPCMIIDLPEEIDAKLAQRLQELIPINEKLTITEISSETIDNELNIIFLPEISKILKSEHLI